MINKFVAFRFKNKYILSFNKVGTAFFKELADETFSVQFSTEEIYITPTEIKSNEFNIITKSGKSQHWYILQSSHSGSEYETIINDSFFDNIQYVVMREPNDRLVSGINYLILKYFQSFGIDEDSLISYSDDKFNNLIINKFLVELKTPADWEGSNRFIHDPHISPYLNDLSTFLDDTVEYKMEYLDINSFNNFYKDNKYFLKFLSKSETENLYLKFKEGYYHSKGRLKSKIKKETMELIIEQIIPNNFLNEDILIYNNFKKVDYENII